MSQGFISRGFGGRRRRQDAALPPGQYLVDGFPVLSAAPSGFLVPSTSATGCAPATPRLLAYPSGAKESPHPTTKEVLPSSGPPPSSV